MNPYMGPKELPVDPVTVTAIQAVSTYTKRLALRKQVNSSGTD